jgi:seryl-tRNA synthetase
MQASNKEKANTLLQIIGVGEKLYELDRQELETYNRRLAIGQISDQKKKFAAEMPYYPDAPKEPISASELIKQQQDILARNGENQRKREREAQYNQEVARLQVQIDELQQKLKVATENMITARKSAQDLHDESTQELEQSINNIETINIKVRANLDKDKAEEDSLDYTNQYSALTAQIEIIRKSKMDLLNNANLPLPGLSVVDGELTYNGKKWDGMSSSEQLKVSVAIIRKLKPQCGFVLIDKLEQMDLQTLHEFGAWLEAEQLQAIATRVSTGDECSIVIEDGYVVGAEQPASPEPPVFKEGVF